MPEAVVRGVHINYEVIGTSGPFIALTPGSRRPYGELITLSKAIAASGYRVLLHDRRNCGKSEIAFDGSASEHEIWADDLYLLARQLGATPLFIGGSSAGARLAILFAMRHPGALRGLLLWRLTGGQEAVGRLAEDYYGAFIKLAEAGGMKAVANSPHFAECIAARPSNRDILIRTDPRRFIEVMTKWREAFLTAAKLPLVGATEADLKAIKAPACLISANDVIHAPATARKAASLFPNNEFHDDVVEIRADDNLKDEWDREEWRNAEPRLAEIFIQFLEKSERAHAPA